MQIKFIWERIKKRKLGYLIIVIALALIWLPTFTPDDLFFVPLIIGFLGYRVYLTIALIIIGIILFNLNHIKPLMKNPSESEARKVCSNLHKTESAINKCIKENVLKNFEGE